LVVTIPTTGQTTWDISEHLAIQRKRFDAELQDNPHTLKKLLYLVDREVGSQGTKAQQMFLETVVNRAAARNEDIEDVMTPAYYPPMRKRVVSVGKWKERHYTGLLDAVLDGSNLSHFATDNASAGLAANRRARYSGVTSGGEFFYVDRPYTHFLRKMQAMIRGHA
jgi:hypothetical protein